MTMFKISPDELTKGATYSLYQGTPIYIDGELYLHQHHITRMEDGVSYIEMYAEPIYKIKTIKDKVKKEETAK